MKETSVNTTLNQYLRETRFYCYYELKVVRGLYFNFKKIEVNQDEGLPPLQREGLVWKLSDEDSRKKPCDGFCAPPLPAFLVLKFGKTFYFIKYEYVIKMKEGGQKSITEDECKAIATKIVHT